VPKLVDTATVGRPRRANAKYPWDEWIVPTPPGKRVLLEHGVDFDCRPNTMETSVRREAKARSLGVHVRLVPGETSQDEANVEYIVYAAEQRTGTAA
jgi:hypothetical protein